MLSFVDDTGIERFMGNLMPESGLAYAWDYFADADVIPRGEWPALIQAFPAGPDDPTLTYVHDQDGVGQCNCDCSVAIVETCRIRAGLPAVKLSAADLYDRINGGQDQGSLLEDALEELRTRGVGTAETCGTLWKRGMRQASAEERARFKALEWVLCPTFDHLMSASIRGWLINSGIMWHSNFKPDGDGWLPSRGSGQPGGHSVMGYKPAMREGRGGTEFGIWHQNSWTAQWGVGGRCVFPESAYKGPVGGWFAIRVVTTEEGDIPAPAGR
jgi:hypothetical protein